MTLAPARAAGAAAALALVVAACGGGGDDAADTTTTSEESTTTTSTTTTSTTTTSSTTTTTTIPEPEEPVARQPLTGEPLDSEDDLEERPALAVKIDNAPPGRPNQSGFSEADLVFEEIVEGGFTRFAAVFHTQDADPIGPIRSGRTQDVDLLASLNQPLFGWSGGNAGVTRIIRDAETLTDLNWQNNVGSYSRGPGPAPNNLYSSTERLYELTPEDHPGAPAQQFGYVLPGDDFGGQSVVEVDIDMASIDVQWTWNDDDEVWERSQEGDPHEEGDGDRITSVNIVVMAVEYRPSAVDATSPEAQTTGEGTVYVFSDGGLIEGKWSREEATEPIALVDLEGEPILLTPGRTWIELADVDDAPDDSEAPIPIDIDFGDEA